MQIKKNLSSNIPECVTHVTSTLEGAGFEAYLVGGCVRDMVLGVEPKDWDVTTNAKPEDVIALFEKTVYENTFGTVAVCLAKETHPQNTYVSPETLEADDCLPNSSANCPRETKNYLVEVTPYRQEAKYSDFRHPDEVKFSENLEDDLKRRDFTCNAMAYRNGAITDMFDGIKDIEQKVLRTVGSPDERFGEDALRMLRAVRFSCQLGFSVSHETMESIIKNASLIKNISSERIRDELVKIVMTNNGASGLEMLHRFGLLKHIIPELEEGIGCEQSGEHIYDVWNHLLHALQHAIDKDWPLEIRLSALFHDIGKPRSRSLATQKNALHRPHPVLNLQEQAERSESSSGYSSAPPKKKYTFYGHEVVGAKMVKKIMERLKFPMKQTEYVEKMVRNHMFFSDPEKITLSAVRRIIKNVSGVTILTPQNDALRHSRSVLGGQDSTGHSEDSSAHDFVSSENLSHQIWDLMKVRECDRVGMAKKEAPYRLRKYHAMIEEALHDPISVKQLKIDGNYLMKELHVKPGPRMGWMLHVLLEEVLEDPSKNTVENLTELVKKLEKLEDSELKTLGEKGKEKKDELEGEEVEKLHKKHGVRKE